MGYMAEAAMGNQRRMHQILRVWTFQNWTTLPTNEQEKSIIFGMVVTACTFIDILETRYQMHNG